LLVFLFYCLAVWVNCQMIFENILTSRK